MEMALSSGNKEPKPISRPPLEVAEDVVQQAIDTLKDERSEQRDPVNILAINHALATYAFKSKDLTAQRIANSLLVEPSYVVDRIKRLEQTITDPEQAVVMADRASDLNTASCVLAGTSIMFIEKNCAYDQDHIEIDQNRVLPLFQILQGHYSGSTVNEGIVARWLVGKETVRTQVEKWCLETENLEEPLRSIIVKDKLVKVFNICFDLSVKTRVDFLEEDGVIKNTINRHKDAILEVLQDQIEKHTKKYVGKQLKKQNHQPDAPRRLPDFEKYFDAFEKLGRGRSELPKIIRDYALGYIAEHGKKNDPRSKEEVERATEVWLTCFNRLTE